MAFWRTLQSGPDGIRAAMHLSYEKHLKKALSGKIGVETDPPHSTAMFGALGTRNKVSGYPVNEPYIWIELSPFLELEAQLGVEALADYAVWRELPNELTEPQLENLANTINGGLLQMLKKKHPALQIAIRPDFAIPWASLISKQTRTSVNKMKPE